MEKLTGYLSGSVSQNCENGGKKTEYYISLEMAKELAMVESNEKGKIARKYFIECEKQLKKVFEIPQTYSQALFLAGSLRKKMKNRPSSLRIKSRKLNFMIELLIQTLQ